MTLKRPLYLLVAALAAGLIAAGCGDDDDDTTTGATGASGATGAEALETSDLSKSEWIEAADQICAKGDQEIDQQGQEFFAGAQGGQPSEGQLSQFATEVLVPEVQDQIDQLRELGAPEGDEDQVSAILDAAQQGVDQVEQDPSLIAQEGGGEDPFAEANKLAGDYGLKKCGGD